MSPSGVIAQLVKMAFFVAVSMAFGFDFMLCLSYAEEPVLGIDGIQPAVGAEFHPSNVVADGFHFPPPGIVGISMARSSCRTPTETRR